MRRILLNLWKKCGRGTGTTVKPGVENAVYCFTTVTNPLVAS